MATKPFVSVVTATRNRIGLLRKALDSIAAQEYGNYEVIVVDDGSDETVQRQYDEIFKQLPANFELHRARPAGQRGDGPGVARNFGIQLAKGDYVAFLDDDDRWIRTDHLSVAAEAIAAQNADLFFADMQAFRGDKLVWETWFPDLPQLTSGTVVHECGKVHRLLPRTIRLLARRHGAHPDGWVVRRKVLTELNGFWNCGAPSEDYELFARLLDRAKVILYRPKVIAAYRLPEGDAVSLKYTLLEEYLKRAMNSLHVRATCNNKWTLRASRASFSWSLRQLAQMMLKEGRLPAARSFAFQAVCTYPTLGTMAFTLQVLYRSMTHSAREKLRLLEKPSQSGEQQAVGANNARD